MRLSIEGLSAEALAVWLEHTIEIRFLNANFIRRSFGRRSQKANL